MSARGVALVTGSNKGIGLAVVRALCEQYDGDVYLMARDVARGTASVDALRKEGLAPLFRQLDITDPDSVRAARDFFTAQYGGVDVLINNAGIAYKNSDPFHCSTNLHSSGKAFQAAVVCSASSQGRSVGLSRSQGSVRDTWVLPHRPEHTMSP